MYRATTPTHRFYFPKDLSEYSEVLVTYKQKGTIKLEKHKADLTIDGKEAKIVLTQAETKAFSPGDRSVAVQIRALESDGTARASKTYTINVNDVLNDEVLT